jgi:hypothetical protein
LLLTSGEDKTEEGYGNNKTFDHAYMYRRTRADDIQGEMLATPDIGQTARYQKDEELCLF